MKAIGPLPILLACGFAALLSPAAGVARAQGVLNFNTRVTGRVDARVHQADGVTPLAGDVYFAQLYFGPDVANPSLVAVGTPRPFRTGAFAGYVSPTDVVVPGVAPGATVLVEMRAWDASGGVASYETALDQGRDVGRSNRIKVVLGAPGGPSGAVPGLDSPYLAAVGGDLAGLAGFVLGDGFLVSFGFPTSQNFSLPGPALNESCGLAVGAKVIRRILPEASGRVTVRTVGSPVDAVLEGHFPYYLAGDASTLLGCGAAPSGPEAGIAFDVVGDQTYWITVAAVGGQAGTVQVEYLLEPLPLRLSLRRTPDGRLQFDLTGAAADQRCVIERSDQWPPVNWAELPASDHAADARGAWSFTAAPETGRTEGYFRARTVP